MTSAAFVSAIIVGMMVAIAAVFLIALILLDAFDRVEDPPDQLADRRRLGAVAHNHHFAGDNDA